MHWMVEHITCCRKRRPTILVGPIHDRLHQLIEQVVQEHGWQILELAIQADPVHLFLPSHPYSMPTALARLIKGRSSHTLRQEFPHLRRMPSVWTRSTFYSTAGTVSSDVIKQSSERQSKP